MLLCSFLGCCELSITSNKDMEESKRTNSSSEPAAVGHVGLTSLHGPSRA